MNWKRKENGRKKDDIGIGKDEREKGRDGIRYERRGEAKEK